MNKYTYYKAKNETEYKGVLELRQRNRLKSNYFFDDDSEQLKEILEERQPGRIQKLSEWFQHFIEDEHQPEVLFPIRQEVKK